MSIGDLNWARLIAWRHLAAQFFDMPGMLARLAQIHGVAVDHGRDGSTIQARLLGGWVQGRMATMGLDVPLELRPDDAYEHGVCRFVIHTSGLGEQARFSVTHQPGARLCAEVRVGDQDLIARTVRLARRPTAELLGIELTLPGHDTLFEEALAAALR